MSLEASDLNVSSFSRALSSLYKTKQKVTDQVGLARYGRYLCLLVLGAHLVLGYHLILKEQCHEIYTPNFIVLSLN